jgi:conjugal transfer pilus assembly protein TraW
MTLATAPGNPVAFAHPRAALVAAAPTSSAAQAAFNAGAAFGRLLKAQTPNGQRRPADAPPQTPAQQQQIDFGQAAARVVTPSAATLQQSSGRAAGQALLPSVDWMGRLERAAQTASENPRAILNETIDGMPVLPPGMSERQASMYLSHDWPKERERTAHVVVLLSLGMPKSVIRNIFEQVVSNPDLRAQTLFLMRGWANESLGFPKTASELNRLQPAGPYKVSVAVDPTWFESLHVKRVPEILVVNEPKMGVISGDGLSIQDAVQRIRAQRDLNKTYGHTWAIAEPDVLKEMQERVKTTNWNAVEQKAKNTMWAGIAQKAPAMPEQDASTVSYFNPSIVATRDIRLPDGRYVVHKGDVINPLAQAMPWQTLRYITFNANKPWEVQQALAWAQQYPNAKIMMAAPPADLTGWKALEDAFQKQLFILEPMVAQRLGIHALPSVTAPSGLSLQTYTQGKPHSVKARP